MNKSGNYKYGIMLYLILGLLVLSISLVFIFSETVFGNGGEREVCWQSVQLRATMPDSGLGVDSLDFKSDFPLKCKTSVVQIEKSDIEDIKVAQKKIAETMAMCWALYGNGDLNVFPSKFFKSSNCVPCARIHLTNDAKKLMDDDKIKININIKEALNLRMNRDITYYSYLKNSGDRFSALDFGNAIPFNLNGESFGINGVEYVWKYIELRNKIGGNFEAKMSSINVSLPEVFDFDKGDLLINYGAVSIDEGKFGDYIPYLFYFQSGQKDNPFNEVKKDIIFNPSSVLWDRLKDMTIFSIMGSPKERINEIKNSGVSFCESWDGILA